MAFVQVGGAARPSVNIRATGATSVVSVTSPRRLEGIGAAGGVNNLFRGVLTLGALGAFAQSSRARSGARTISGKPRKTVVTAVAGPPAGGIALFSPAKVNLFLRVTGKRPDGFHELASLFHAVAFG